MVVPVQATTQEAVTTLTLARPEAMNALTTEMAGALVGFLIRAEMDAEVQAVVLTGYGGRAFCAGVDVTQLAGLSPESVADWFTAIAEVYRQILRMDKPVIAAIDGVAAGAGFQIGLCADFRIATARSRLGQPELKAGLPSIMGSYFMDHCVGRVVNQDLSLTGRLVGAEEALSLRLINRIVPDSALIDEAVSAAKSFAATGPTAWKATKQRFRRALLAGFDEALAEAIAGQRSAILAGDVSAALARLQKPRGS